MFTSEPNSNLGNFVYENSYTVKAIATGAEFNISKSYEKLLLIISCYNGSATCRAKINNTEDIVKIIDNLEYNNTHSAISVCLLNNVDSSTVINYTAFGDACSVFEISY